MSKSKPAPRKQQKKTEFETSHHLPFVNSAPYRACAVSIGLQQEKGSAQKPPVKPPITAPEKPSTLPEKPLLPPVKEKARHQKNSSQQEADPQTVLFSRHCGSCGTPPKITGTAVVAIIIDDMGTDVSEVRELMNIGVPLTFSVIPGLHQSREVATVAHNSGYEVMLHIPMEPQGYPQRRLEKNGLLMAYGDKEIEARMRGFMNVIPHAVGANNHMGSRFTEDRGKMDVVLKCPEGKWYVLY